MNAVLTEPHKLPAVAYQPTVPAACLHCTHWLGNRSAGGREPGRCTSPRGMYSGGIVAGRERCNHFEREAV
jgi:hypothetical protein